MKTPMQEWFDELKANYPYMANEIYQKGFQKYLEKEKEQMQDFAKRCLNKALDLDIRTAYEMVEEYHKQKYSSSQPTFGDVGSQPTFGYISPQTTNQNK